MRKFVAACAFIMLVAAPASAQLRKLDVPNDKGWQHAQTGIILTSKLGTFQRFDLKDNGANELDISANFQGSSADERLSIYIYRPGIHNLPMWFDRSHFAMTTNPLIKTAAGSMPIQRVGLPGSTVESGLRITYPFQGGAIGGTGLAMVPFGDWLVAIRMTSPHKTAAEIDAGLVDILGKIRWPKVRPAEQVAVPVAPCADVLKTRKAKVYQPDLGQALLGATLSNIVQKKAKEAPATDAKPTILCRQGAQSPEFGMYRNVESKDGYVIAIGDAGISASVCPGFSLNDRKEFAVTLSTHNSMDTYPSFDALPDPKQVFALVTSRGPISRAMRNGENIVLAPTGK